jgi:hypothetical protein
LAPRKDALSLSHSLFAQQESTDEELVLSKDCACFCCTACSSELYLKRPNWGEQLTLLRRIHSFDLLQQMS